MESVEEIEREIKALYVAVEERRRTITSSKYRTELMDVEKDVKLLEESWNYAKEEQQHLFEETRKNFEAQIYKIVGEIKTIEEKAGIRS